MDRSESGPYLTHREEMDRLDAREEMARRDGGPYLTHGEERQRMR